VLYPLLYPLVPGLLSRVTGQVENGTSTEIDVGDLRDLEVVRAVGRRTDEWPRCNVSVLMRT
jgi:hypothetical protein